MRRGAVSVRFIIGLGALLVFFLYFILGSPPTGIRREQSDPNRLSHKVEDLGHQDGAIKQSGEKERGNQIVYPHPIEPGSQRLVARQNSPPPEDDICQTQACKDYGAYIKRSLGVNYTSIDPCADFWNFAVGNWQSFNNYRPDQSSVSSFSVLDDSNRDLLRKVLESPYNQTTTLSNQDRLVDRDNFIKMKTAYDACLDEDLIKTVGAKPIKDILDAVPKPDSGKYDTTNGLTDILISLLRLGVTPLVGADTGSDLKNPDVVTIYLDSGGLGGLPSKEYYNRTDVQTNYTRTIAEIFDIFLGNNGTHGNIAQQVFELERRIALAQLDPEQERDVELTYNPYKLEDVDKLVPDLSHTQLVNAFTPPGYEADTVIVKSVEYFRQLSQLIRSVPTDVLYAYFQWNIIREWADSVYRDLRIPLRRFNNQLAGRPDDAIQDRWRTCQQEVDSNMPWILSGAYVQARAFGQDSKSLGEQIIDDIRAIYEERFPNYDWMAKDVQERSKKKVSLIGKKIGYPDKSPNVLDPRSVQEFYANLTVSRTKYFENKLNITYFSSNRSWDDLLRPTDKDRWAASANTINAYYFPNYNQINFPAGIMQVPFFDRQLPEYVSYGGFGAIAGHEITHGFDDQGSKFDERGAFATWWDQQTRDNFKERTKCFVQQYAKYSIPGLDDKPVPIKGELTQGENIADAGGVSSSYEAWKRRNDKKRNQMLPGLPEDAKLTPEKLFFVSFANIWAQKARRRALVQQVLSDPHTPNEQRVLGVLANSRPFKEAFECKDTNPVCELW
ncbi:endothelin-converting enzyme [Phyllosticta capitalensis]|uniref:Endothelin-converting enzyme n=1 Tax=Phyllosticta capitalensis TaxID=121624 RepID=A0ABR1YWS4_9PEZI